MFCTCCCKQVQPFVLLNSIYISFTSFYIKLELHTDFISNHENKKVLYYRNNCCVQIHHIQPCFIGYRQPFNFQRLYISVLHLMFVALTFCTVSTCSDLTSVMWESVTAKSLVLFQLWCEILTNNSIDIMLHSLSIYLSK